MKSIVQKLARLALAALALGGMPHAHAAGYPDRPVHLVVAYPPGGSTDSTARILAEHLSKLWGQPVIVENKAGASGRLAMAQVAKDTPDGYTFVMVTNSTISDELLQAGDANAFKISRELLPVTICFTTPVVLVVNKSAGVNTLAEYIALAKSKPGAVSFGTTGQATSTHFYGEMLKHETGIEITHIPFNGEGPNVTNLLGGHVTSSFLSAFGARKTLPTGKVTLLAVTTPKRSPLLPDVPSFDELGIKGIDFDSWAGFFAPIGTPQAVIDKFAADVQKVLTMPEVAERIRDLGMVALASTPKEFAARIQSDKVYWSNAIKITGITLN